MLQHLKAGDGVEFAGALARELLGTDVLIRHLEPGFLQVQPRHRQRRLAEIDAGDVGAERRHAFGQEAATAADVEHALVFQSHAVVDELQAQRVDVVQRLELGLRVPPARGELLELGKFGGIDVLSVS